jgi:hypothetical protein
VNIGDWKCEIRAILMCAIMRDESLQEDEQLPRIISILHFLNQACPRNDYSKDGRETAPELCTIERSIPYFKEVLNA